MPGPCVSVCGPWKHGPGDKQAGFVLCEGAVLIARDPAGLPSIWDELLGSHYHWGRRLAPLGLLFKGSCGYKLRIYTLPMKDPVGTSDNKSKSNKGDRSHLHTWPDR